MEIGGPRYATVGGVHAVPVAGVSAEGMGTNPAPSSGQNATSSSYRRLHCGQIFIPIGEMITAAVGFAVALRTWRVFPFDFTGYDTDWSWLVRLILIIVMVGTAIGFVAESVKLARGPDRSPGTSS